jgi:hypothetical protein
MGSSPHHYPSRINPYIHRSDLGWTQETYSLRHHMAIKKNSKPKTQTLVFTQVVNAICNLIVVTVMLIGIITLYDIASYIINIKK